MRAALSVPLALVALFAAATARAEGPPAVPVVVDPVRMERVQETTSVIARVVTERHGPVAAEVAGRVVAVEVRAGERVDAGAPLVRLDPQRFELALRIARAELARAEAAVSETEAAIALLEQEIARLERLRGSSAFPRATFEDRLREREVQRARLAAARAGVELARANVEARERDLADATVTAPHAGVITAVRVAPGARVAPGDAVVEMLDPASFEVEAQLAAERLRDLRAAGGLARVRTESGEVPVRLRAVVPVESPTSRTRPARLAVEGDPAAALFADGQTVELLLPAGEPRERPTVHKDAIVPGQGRYLVYVVQDGKAVPREVVPGPAVGDRVAVEGLEPGTPVVVRGNERLRPGQPVVVAGGGGQG